MVPIHEAIAVLKPSDLPKAARIFIGLGSCCVAALMLLPAFQGAEKGFGLTDKQAHAAAFYVFTLTAFLALPRMRRTDIALAALGLGAAAEVAQLVTGRSGSVMDLSADAVGICLAWAPTQIEHLRRVVRRHPGRTFAEIRALDRRKRPSVKAPATRSRPADSAAV